LPRSESYSRFDVVVVPFPYTDRLSERRRPALVVSREEIFAAYGLVWLVMITSATNAGWDCDITILDSAAAGLPSASLIRPVKIATIDGVRIDRRIGALSAADRKAVTERMRELFLP
jgi:mRNA interferase MazF